MADIKPISQRISSLVFYTLSIPLLGIICWSCSSNTSTETPKPEAQPETTAAENKPEKAADISLTLSDAEGFKELLAKQNGKVVLVDFWATWCVPCVKNFHHSVEWNQKYADKGLSVISVSMDESDEDTQKAVLEFLKSKEAQFTNILATAADDQNPMETFDVDDGYLPHYRVYDRSGKLIKKFFFSDTDQQFTQEDIETAIQEALKQKPE